MIRILRLSLISSLLRTAGAATLAATLLGGSASALPDVLNLLVDRTTGQVQIQTAFSTTAITFDFYEIDSATGSLNFAGWNSLHNQQIDKLGDGPGEQWEEAGASSNFTLTEAFLFGSTQLSLGETISLGTAYDPFVGAQDLIFRYSDVANSGSLTPGFVTYIGAPPPLVLPGDYNANGIVDALDASLWASNLGSTTIGGGADGDGNGIVGPEDYQLIVAHLGEAVGGGLPVDPTPASLIYNAASGKVMLDQTDAVGGKITAFVLNNGANALITPGAAHFPFQTPVTGGGLSVPTEFDNSQKIGQIDVHAAGLPSTQFALGSVLPPGLTMSQLQAALAGSFYLPVPGNVSSPFNLVRIVPEPSAITLAIVVSFLILPRHMRGRKAKRSPHSPIAAGRSAADS